MKLAYVPRKVSQDLEDLLDQLYRLENESKPTQVVLQLSLGRLIREQSRHGSRRDFFELLDGRIVWLVHKSAFLMNKHVADRVLKHARDIDDLDLVRPQIFDKFDHFGGLGLSLSKSQHVYVAASNKTTLLSTMDTLIPLLCKDVWPGESPLQLRRVASGGSRSVGASSNTSMVVVSAFNSHSHYRACQSLSTRSLNHILSQKYEQVLLCGLKLSVEHAWTLGSRVTGTLKLRDMLLQENSSSNALFSSMRMNRNLKHLALEHVVVSEPFSEFIRHATSLVGLSLDHNTLSWLSGRFRINVKELSVANSFLTSDILDNILWQPKIEYLCLDGCRMLERPQGFGLRGLPRLKRLDLPGTLDHPFLCSQDDWSYLLQLLQDHASLSFVSVHVFGNRDSEPVRKEKIGWAARSLRQVGFQKMLEFRHPVYFLDEMKPLLSTIFEHRQNAFADAPIALLPLLLARKSHGKSRILGSITDLSDQFSLLRAHVPGLTDPKKRQASWTNKSRRRRKRSRPESPGPKHIVQRRPRAADLIVQLLLLLRIPFLERLRRASPR